MNKRVKRLISGFHPSGYALRLEPDVSGMSLKGTVTIEGLKAGRPSSRLTFHQVGLKISSAKIVRTDKKGQREIGLSRINHHGTMNEVRIHTAELMYPGQYSVSMEFTGHIQRGMHGVYGSTYETGTSKHTIVSTQFESHHAREAFPCIDEPEAKATFDLTLVSPIGEAVIGNMPISHQEERDGKLVTSFERTPKMSTYLLAFVFGDMQFKENRTDGGISVRVWSTKAQPAESLDFALDVATRGIEFFNRYYGIPYPLAKCDHVAIPDFSAGAMENWGLITYRERCLLVDPKTASQTSREVVATVILHELSHQWFGNLVTMRWWDDLWLNESFANVMEYVASDALFPEWQIWNSFISQEGLSALRRDAIAGVQPVSTDVRHPDEISTLFDPSIVYAKGGRLLNMLMRYVGEQSFRAGLKGYFTKHAYGNTTGEDLWGAIGAASGNDIASFMTPWLDQSGFPEVVINQHGTRLNISQRHFLLDMAKTDPSRQWPVPLLSPNSAVPDLLDKLSIDLTAHDDKPIRLNEGAVGHYIVRYANPTHAAAIAGLVSSHNLGIAERLMLLNDSVMLARAGSQSFVSTIDLLGHYSDEESEPVWDIMALVIADMRRFVDIDPTLDDDIKAFVRRIIATQYERLGWDERPNESNQDTKLRATIIGLGVYGDHSAIVSRAIELFERYKSDPAGVPHELRGTVFAASVRHGSPDSFDYLLALDGNTNNADLKHDILGALSSTKEQERASVLLARLKDSEQVRPQDIDSWLASLLANRYTRNTAWSWLRENWPWIEETFRGDKSYDYLPRYAANAMSTRTLLDEYVAFFSPLMSQPALTRNVAMGIEEITTRVHWLERDLQPVVSRFRSTRL